MPRVTHLSTAVPDHFLEQDQAALAVTESLGLSEHRGIQLRDLFRRSQVERRYSVMDSTQLAEKRDLSERMEMYRAHAAELGLRAARGCLERSRTSASDIDMVVTCSCTGLLLPSLSVLIAENLGLRKDVRRIPITEAGCAGGASALARADEFLRAYPQARALIVAVELPTLTLQHEDCSRANLVASAIFGDGAAAALIEGDRARGSTRAGLQIVATHSEVLPASTSDLGFDLREGGLHIVLSQHVPQIISSHLPRIIDDFLRCQELTRSQLSFFVLHPGGRKVLDCVETCLELKPAATETSRATLRDYGNQSSASVLFVLEKTLSGGAPTGYGLLAAFGPGITVELSLLRGAPC